MKRLNVFKSLAVLFIFSQIAWGLVPNEVEGAVPQLINFQGVLKDGTGNPVANGSYSVTFTIYDAFTGGNVVWAETTSVSTTSGLFSVLLGSLNPVPDSAFNSPNRWMGVKISSDLEMTPRQQMVSNAYAYRVATVDGATGGTISGNAVISTGPLSTTEDLESSTLTLGPRPNSNIYPISTLRFIVNDSSRAVIEYNNEVGYAPGLLGLVLYNNGWPPTEPRYNMVIKRNGNVGIGTTSPSRKLHVDADFPGTGTAAFTLGVGAGVIGDASVSIGTAYNFRHGLAIRTSNNAIGDGSHAALWIENDGLGGHTFYAGDQSSDPTPFVIDNGGNVGIGTSAPGERLHIVRGDGSNSALKIENTTSGTGVVSQVVLSGNPSNPYDWGLNASESGFFLFNNGTRVAVDTGGNMGIGTTSPLARLHVVGGNVFIGTNNPPFFTSGSRSLFVENNSGDFNNSFRIDGANDILYLIASSQPGAAAGAGIIFRTAPAGLSEFDRMIVTPEGSVGIGTTSPLDKLHVNGEVRVNSCVKNSGGAGIAGTCASDIRLKKDVKSFSPLLDKLARLEPVSFNWRTDEYPELNLPKVEDQGLIAQEVEKVLPELVTEDEKGFKAIEYHRLPLMTLQAVKELKAENDQLKAELQTLKALVEKWAAEKKERDKKIGQLR